MVLRPKGTSHNNAVCSRRLWTRKETTCISAVNAKILSKVQNSKFCSQQPPQQPDENCCMSASNWDRALICDSYERCLKVLFGFYNLVAWWIFLHQPVTNFGSTATALATGCISASNIIDSFCFRNFGLSSRPIWSSISFAESGWPWTLQTASCDANTEESQSCCDAHLWQMSGAKWGNHWQVPVRVYVPGNKYAQFVSAQAVSSFRTMRSVCKGRSSSTNWPLLLSHGTDKFMLPWSLYFVRQHCDWNRGENCFVVLNSIPIMFMLHKYITIAFVRATSLVMTR